MLTQMNSINRPKFFCNEKRQNKIENILEFITVHYKNFLNEKLNRIFHNYVPTNEQIARSQKFLSEISAVVRDIIPRCKLCFYGSYENGFLTKESDLDIAVMFDDEEPLLREEQIRHLKSLFLPLYHWRLKDLKEIYSAKLPIIKFQTNDLSGDISVHNVHAVINTNLLKFYCQFDPNVKKLGLLLKFVVKRLMIADVRSGTLSSYAYTILLIHYLQKENILPVVQELLNDTDLIPYDEWYSRNEKYFQSFRRSRYIIQSLSDLWIGFFKYYTMEFNLNTVVSIRCQLLLKSTKNWNDSHLAIEDPINASVNLGSHLNLCNYKYILKCFYKVLLAKGDVFKVIGPNDIELRIPESDPDYDDSDSDDDFNINSYLFNSHPYHIDYDSDSDDDFNINSYLFNSHPYHIDYDSDF